MLFLTNSYVFHATLELYVVVGKKKLQFAGMLVFLYQV